MLHTLRDLYLFFSSLAESPRFYVTRLEHKYHVLLSALDKEIVDAQVRLEQVVPVRGTV